MPRKKRHGPSTHIEDSIPDEVWIMIFAFLNPHELLKLNLVSRHFLNLSNDDSLWKVKLQNTFFREIADFHHVPSHSYRHTFFNLMSMKNAQSFFAFYIEKDIEGLKDIKDPEAIIAFLIAYLNEAPLEFMASKVCMPAKTIKEANAHSTSSLEEKSFKYFLQVNLPIEQTQQLLKNKHYSEVLKHAIKIHSATHIGLASDVAVNVPLITFNGEYFACQGNVLQKYGRSRKN